MAYESCKVFVEEALEDLKISPIKIELGEIETKEEISDEQKKKVNKKIKEFGSELLEKMKVS